MVCLVADDEPILEAVLILLYVGGRNQVDQ